MKFSNSKSEYSNSKFIQSSSFKRIIRGVESLVQDDDDLQISTFQYQTHKHLNKLKSQTNGQKLQEFMGNPELRQKINMLLNQQGYLDLFPILKIDIQSLSGRQIEFPILEEDLFGVLKRFGDLERILILGDNNYAFFNDHISAYFAWKTLNDLTFRSVGAELKVRWCQQHQYYQLSGFLNFDRNCPLPILNRSNSISGPASKFTCRFKIQIQNQKQFQVARRIIGPKGMNMKKIIDTCLDQIGLDPNIDSDIIKLRLRGQGSGYKEGPTKMESEDPLHLCISCKEEKVYMKACGLVESLLNKIYQQYKNFCIRTGWKIEQLKCLRMDANTAQILKPSYYNFENSGGECLQLNENDIRMYIQARNKARREMNFMQADRIRSLLKSKGITLMDEKGGRGRGVEVTTWRITRTRQLDNSMGY